MTGTTKSQLCNIFRDFKGVVLVDNHDAATWSPLRSGVRNLNEHPRAFERREPCVRDEAKPALGEVVDQDHSLAGTLRPIAPPDEGIRHVRRAVQLGTLKA